MYYVPECLPDFELDISGMGREDESEQDDCHHNISHNFPFVDEGGTKVCLNYRLYLVLASSAPPRAATASRLNILGVYVAALASRRVM